MYLEYLSTKSIKITVQFEVFLCLALCLSLCRIPVVRGDIAVGVYLRTLSVHRDTEDNGCFALLVNPCLPCDEIQGKVRFIG